MIKLAPSILAANFAALGNDIKAIENAGAHYVHIDVMDGNFVNNISLGFPVIKSIRALTNMTFDVHLMIDKPEKYIEKFAEAGADIINIHIESTDKVKETLIKIRELGKIPAITVKPDTKIEEIYPYIEYVEMVLIMTVEPGFGGQKFMLPMLNKVEKLRKYADENNFLVDIEVDGGISLDNLDNVLNAGANIIVVGSSVFNTNDTNAAIAEFYKKFDEVGARL